MDVLESAKFITDNSKHVKCNMEGIKNAAKFIFENLKTQNYSVKTWKQHDLNPSVADEDALNWIFFVDVLNFSFWSDKTPPFTVKYKNKNYTGYTSLCASVNRALDSGIPLTTPSFYATITEDVLGEIFKSETDDCVPMLKERVSNLREVGSRLLTDYQGSVTKLVESCNNSAVCFVNKLVKEFPCFSDKGVFEGREVSYLKRAQITVADIWACFEGEGVGNFTDIDELTMFADYRVPQSMVFLNIMEYDDILLEKLNNKVLFQNGDREEQEIRGCSIWGVELVKQELLKLLSETNTTSIQQLNAIIIDFHLWDYAKAHTEEMKSIPIHRVRSIYY